MGVLSQKLINCTHLGGVIYFYLRFIPGHTFVSPTSLSPVQRLDGPSTHDGTYFYRSRAHVFWVGWRFHTMSTNIYTWFIVCFGCLYFLWIFVTTVLQTSKKFWWRCCSRQHVRIYNSICSNVLQLYLYSAKIVSRTDRSSVWHRYLGLKICSNNFSFNIVTL